MPKVSRFKLPPVDFGGETLGERITRIRKERGFTQVELASRIGIIQTIISAIETYDNSFFAGKSNNPYLWRAPESPKHIPWVQFVGYQLRHDGLLRVRRKSIDKHVKSITDVTNSLLGVLDKGAYHGGLRRTAKQIHYRFHQKLISMSVGRIRRNKKRKGPMPMCWAAGFRGLAGRRFVTTNIRYLDRHRERQLRRVARRLQNLSLPKATKESDIDALPYYGYPFSYIAQFK